MSTLIGNMERLAFELVPVTPSWERRYSAESAAWAGLAIWIDGRNVCSHVEPGSAEIKPHLFVPLGPVADWLVRSFPALAFEERARDFPTGSSTPHRDATRWGLVPPPAGCDMDEWFAAREAWWSHHFLRAGAEGARLPNLAFVRDGEHLVCSWRTPQFVQPGGPRMVWPDGQFEVPWSEAALIFDGFVSTVRDSFKGEEVTDAYAWTASQRPLREYAGSLEEMVELYCGRDIVTLQAIVGASDASSTLESLHLPATATDPAESPHCQVLRDLSNNLSADVGGLLRELGDRVFALDVDRAQRWQQARAIALDAGRAGGSPEAAGQHAANELRRHLRLDGQPVANLAAVLGELGVDASESGVDGGRDRMMVAARLGGSPVAVTLGTSRTQTAWGVRFEQSRALGHVLLDSLRGKAIGAASGPFAGAVRRRRAGAFAAEFLLPETTLDRASNGRLDGVASSDAFGALMAEFGVGARTAAFQLWNRGWLSSPAVRDELVDRHAAA
jgi:hypothetical protein